MTRPTMQAIRVHQYGGPEQLRLEEIPRPEPQAGEVLIRVHAAGVLPADAATRQGLFISKSFPYIPGTAVAGVIEAVGPGGTTFQTGQAVCGRAPNGTYAEYTTVLVDQRQFDTISLLASKPETLSFDEAATLSAGATTAWTAIFEDGGLQAGQRVLIHGAAGGVGLFAVQFARWKGAQVIGTASTANLDFVHSLGAETVIDYTTTPFEEVVQDVDLVLDTMGGETLQRSMKIVKRGGTLVSLVEEPAAELAQAYGVHAIHNQVRPTSEHLQAIVQLINAGHAKPTIRRTFALHQAPQAHELVQTGHGRGRIVLHIAEID
jgi:NADPH:quinone reductase-like Zn-dependent oxidoreductase